MKREIMKALKFPSLVCIIWIAINSFSYCQTVSITDSTIKHDTWSATLNTGFLMYFGNLDQKNYFPFGNNELHDFPGGGGVSLSKQLSPCIGIEAMLEDGNVLGMNKTENEYFKANMVIYGFNIKIDFLPLINPNIKSPKIDVYGIAGIGFCEFKTYVKKLSKIDTVVYSYGYGEDGQTKRRTTETNIPLGVGIKYRLSNKFDIGVQSTFNFVNTRKIDAYNVTNNNAPTDKYLYTAITLSYRFHFSSSKVPKSIIYNPQNNNAISQKKDTVIVHDYSTVFVKDLSGNNSATQNQGKNDTAGGKNFTTTPNNSTQKKDTTSGKNIKNTSKSDATQNNSNHNNGNTTNPASINGLFFTIQIGTFKDQPDLSMFSKLDDIVVEKVNDKKYRVTCGIIQDMLEANVKLEDLVKKGYKDAFLAAYYKGKRITISEAKKIYYNK
jgi:hypothetical protein